MVVKPHIIDRNINRETQLSEKYHPVLRRIYLARSVTSDSWRACRDVFSSLSLRIWSISC